MTSKITINNGVLTPMHFGNLVARNEGDTVTHDPWSAGLAAWLVQAPSAALNVTVSSGGDIVVAANKVVVVTDGDAGNDAALIDAVGPDRLFHNGEIYFGKAGSDLRWNRDTDLNGLPHKSSRIDFALVVQTTVPVGYTATRTGGNHSIEILLPSNGLRVIELLGASQTTRALDPDSTIVVQDVNTGIAMEYHEDDADNGIPWPPK